MSLIAKIQQQSLLQNKLLAQLAEMSYQAVNGTRQAPRNFREGTLEIGKMNFTTPQDRITKEMIMDYQKTEQEKHYVDSAGRWRADIGCTKSVRSEVFNVNFGVKKLKSRRVIEGHRVGTAQISNAKRSNKGGTELPAGKTQVEMLRRKQNRITNLERVRLGQASVTNTKVIGHTME